MHGVLGRDGLDPAQLLETGRAEARAYGVEIVAGAVVRIADEGDRLRIFRGDGTVDLARVVVIATGVRDELPEVPGLETEWGRTVLHCPYCHGWEVAGGRLGVLATPPMSVHQIELVRQFSDDVTAFIPGTEPVTGEALRRLTARGIRVVRATVRAARRRDNALVITTDAYEDHTLDALFTVGAPVIDIDFAADLALVRTDQPGSPLAVDQRGGTSHPRVFAAGNVTAPFANVPVSMGVGSMAGAGANAMLAAEDFDLAVAQRE